MHMQMCRCVLECHVMECVVEGEGNTHVPMRARLCHRLRCTARLFLVDVVLVLRCQTNGRLPDVGGVGGLGTVHGLEVLGATCVIGICCKVAYERPDKRSVAHNQDAHGLRMIYQIMRRSSLSCGTYVLSRFRDHSLGRGLNVVLAGDIRNHDG